jgi:hypothetical protein
MEFQLNLREREYLEDDDVNGKGVKERHRKV